MTTPDQSPAPAEPPDDGIPVAPAAELPDDEIPEAPAADTALPAADTALPARPAGAELGPLELAFAVVALLAGAALFLSGFTLGARTATTPGTPAGDQALFGPFWDTWDSINRSYVGQVDQKKLVEGAIDGMIKALGDPYSSYMSPEELQRAREDLGGQFEGIGAVISARPSAAAAMRARPSGRTAE